MCKALFVAASLTTSSTVGHEFQFEIKEMSPARWRIYVLAHPYDDDESSRVRYRWLHLKPSREQDRICWSRRLRNTRGESLVCWTEQLASPLDAYRVAVVWAEATCNYITAGCFEASCVPDDVPAPAAGSALERQYLTEWRDLR